jgi:hypothetical protein
VTSEKTTKEIVFGGEGVISNDIATSLIQNNYKLIKTLNCNFQFKVLLSTMKFLIKFRLSQDNIHIYLQHIFQ